MSSGAKLFYNIGSGYFDVKTATLPQPPPLHGGKIKMKMERERGVSDVEWGSDLQW